MTTVEVYHLCDECAHEYLVLRQEDPHNTKVAMRRCPKCNHINPIWIRVNTIYSLATRVKKE